MIAVLKTTYSCNLRCTYCYLPESQKSKVARWSLAFSKKVIREIVQTSVIRNDRCLTIIWHGGEPLLWGADNYRYILSFLDNLAKKSPLKVRNIIQTNLTLISEEYIEIFKEHNVSISFSIDGFKETNDLTRKFASGIGTFDTIASKIKLCQDNNIKLSCIVVGNKNHIGKIRELFEFMNALGVNSFKFNPIFNTNQELYENSNISITSDEFAQMVIELFDVWYFHPDARVKESNLIEMCSNIVTQKPSACQFKANCQEIIYAINPTGEVCPCGRFCDDADQYSIGNIKNTHLSEILSKRKLNDLFRRSEFLANGECKGCVFF